MLAGGKEDRNKKTNVNLSLFFFFISRASASKENNNKNKNKTTKDASTQLSTSAAIYHSHHMLRSSLRYALESFAIELSFLFSPPPLSRSILDSA